MDADADAGLTEMLAEVERDHEAMRMRILELLRILEDAVDQQVAGERRIADLTTQCANLEAEIEALHNTRLFRLARPFRSAYSRVRRRLGKVGR